MVKVIFKNLAKSEMIRNIVTDKIQKTIGKFSNVEHLSSTVIVGREHSPEHTGVEWFSVKFLIHGKGIKPIVLEKRAEDLYLALAMVSDRAFELMHRSIEKERLTHRHERRRWKENNKYARSWPTYERAA